MFQTQSLVVLRILCIVLALLIPSNGFQLRENCNVCDMQLNCSLKSRSDDSTRIVQTVDIMIIADRPQDYPYIRNGKFWLMPMIIDRLAVIRKQSDGEFRSDTRIHILSSDNEILEKGMHMGRNIIMWDIRNFTHITQDFYELYKQVHYSVNSMEYEYLCFNRWHLFRFIMENWNQKHSDSQKMRRILTLDLDVLFMKNVAVFFDDMISSITPNYQEALEVNPSIVFNELEHFEYAGVTLGAIALWSSHGLTAFSTYISDWFTKQPLEVVKNIIQAHWKYFSDMILMRNFQQVKNTTRSICFEHFLRDNYHTVVKWRKTNPEIECLLENLGCIPRSHFEDVFLFNNDEFVHTWSSAVNVETTSIDDVAHSSSSSDARNDNLVWSSNSSGSSRSGSLGYNLTVKTDKTEKFPDCLIHFQGKEKKIHMYAVGKFLLHILRYEMEMDRVGEKTLAMQPSTTTTTNSGSGSSTTISTNSGSTTNIDVQQVTKNVCDNDKPMLFQRPTTTEIYYIHHGKRHLIPNFDVFLAYNFSISDILHPTRAIFHFYSLGEELTMDSAQNRINLCYTAV